MRIALRRRSGFAFLAGYHDPGQAVDVATQQFRYRRVLVQKLFHPEQRHAPAVFERIADQIEEGLSIGPDIIVQLPHLTQNIEAGSGAGALQNLRDHHLLKEIHPDSRRHKLKRLPGHAQTGKFIDGIGGEDGSGTMGHHMELPIGRRHFPVSGFGLLHVLHDELHGAVLRFRGQPRVLFHFTPQTTDRIGHG